MGLEPRLFVLKLAQECVHNRILPELGPHEVDLFNLLFIVKEPPEASLEESSYQNRVVTLSHIAFVLMHWLYQGCNSLLKEGIVGHVLRLIFFINDLAQVGDKLLLDHVCNLSALDKSVIEHVLGDGYANLLGQLEDSGCVDLSLLLEAQLNEVVVVVQRYVNPMRLMLIVIIGREDLDLSGRILLSIRVLQNQEGSQRGCLFII